ncbi:MAG: citrate/2-methylcitrate synthase, partial [Cutibacterium granulosum]|nr:citrate/2-methylcitrate synthase [Cutibacterium granulosum]
MTENICTITIDGKSVGLPVVEGTTGDRAIDISRLRELTGVTTLDPSLANTASCRSAISWIDGENGRLLYRGIPIETLAENKVSFVETAMLLITGRLPT